jgi:hypothetical protein
MLTMKKTEVTLRKNLQAAECLHHPAALVEALLLLAQRPPANYSASEVCVLSPFPR